MRTIMILAFVLVGMIGHAQERVSIDSIKVGDEIVFDKNIKEISDANGNHVWTAQKGSSFVVTNVSIIADELYSVSIVDFEGDVYNLVGNELQYYAKKKRLHVCR